MRYAKSHHDVPAHRVHPLGMIWRRNLAVIAKESAALDRRRIFRSERRMILYAGMAPSFFPQESELQAVEAIVAAIRDGTLPQSTVVYRPVITDATKARMIAERYANDPLVDIQWPQPALVGIDESSSGSVRQEVVEYLEQLLAADVLVMSATTTMMFDALHFDIPCIASFVDPTGMLREIGFTTTYIANDETLRGAPSTPVVHSVERLIEEVRTALSVPHSADAVRKQVFGVWDYENTNYVRDFISVIDGLRTTAKCLPTSTSPEGTSVL